MKKILKLFVAFSMFFGLAACGSGDKKDDTSEIRVAMITDSGDITDQSFNQTTYEACKAFCAETYQKHNHKKQCVEYACTKRGYCKRNRSRFVFKRLEYKTCQ